MKTLIEDIELLKSALEQGKDIAEMEFGTDKVADLARDLARRYSRLDAASKRRIRSVSASADRAKLEKDQYKSSLSELQKILDLCRVISSSQDLKDILHHLLFLLSEILPSRGCAVFVGQDGSPGRAPLLSSNFTPQLQQILAQHFEEGIIRWILNERRVCLIPSFEDRPAEGDAAGDFAVIPINDNDSNYGFIWLACTIKQEAVTPETSNLIWVLSSHASIAIMNCLHRQRMEEKLNELKILTSINALKGDVLGSLPTFYREFRQLASRELKLDMGSLILVRPDGSHALDPAPAAGEDSTWADHAEIRKLMRLAGKEQLRLESGEYFRTAYPYLARTLGSAGIALLSLSPAGIGEAYLLIRLSAGDVERIPMLQSLLLAVASQARVVAENIGLYDSLLTANRNLTALQWQLVHSGKMAALGQLAGGVAHEINNPLQIMLGRIQMIQMMADGPAPDGPGKLKDELNLVTEEVLRIRDIVRNLLDFSRQGKRETSFTQVSVDAILKDVLALLKHQLVSGKVEVALKLECAEILIMGNRNQLKQVFINLLMNAVHAMESEPRSLEISTALRNGSVAATIRDSGVGIPQNDIHRIFEPFFSTKSMGTGLGLSISYGIIKEHGGSIEVESQEKLGTCFTVILPKIPEESQGNSLMVG